MALVDATHLSPLIPDKTDHLLIVSYSEYGRQLLNMLGEQRFSTTYTEIVCDALQAIDKGRPSWLVLYLDTEAVGSSQILRSAVEHGTRVLIIGPEETEKLTRQCLNEGAVRFLSRPVNQQRLLRALELDPANEQAEGEAHQPTAFTDREDGNLFSNSRKMQQVSFEVKRVAPTSATVFLRGESGTGKEIVAHAIHQQSSRSGQPFLPVNCGAISPQLIESELFGHEKGSFTGAVREHRGVFERAHGGTLFLDEVTEMPVDLQVKLLRVLETHRFTRVGSDRELTADIRIIAATNCCPETEVQKGRLRSDLLYRLQVFPIVLPPLRERAGDIRFMAERFLSELNELEGTDKRFSRESMDQLEQYPWPGNLRELKNIVQRAFIMSDQVIGVAEIPEEVVRTPGPIAPQSCSGRSLTVQVGRSIADVERELIMATLEECGGKKEKAANILGVSMKTLYNRLRDYHARSQAAR